MMVAPSPARMLVALLTLAAAATAQETLPEVVPEVVPAAAAVPETAPVGFTLQSPDIGPEKEFAQAFTYDAFGCDGDNQSFALNWSGAPAGTQSFAVTTFDPDGMRGKGFWHWFVINLPATTNELPRGAGARDNSKLPPSARQLKSSFNKIGYGGSCPPRGEKPHNYVVTVYALKTRKLDVPADALAEEALPLVEANALAKATLTYKYGRT
jgi:Raf kinase inhibitor-like YbhB/YbcL family protein